MGMTKAELLKEMAQRKAAAEAKHKKFVAESEKKAAKDGRKQIKAWANAIAKKDLSALKTLSSDIEAEYKSQNVTTAGDGGYLVPTVVANNIVEKLKLVSNLRNLFTVIPDAPADLKLNMQAGRPAVAWTAEEAAYNATKATFAPKSIKAFKITGIVPITEEFMQDVANYPAVQALLESQLAQEIGYQENVAFISGDGTTRPLGFRTLTLPGGQVKTFASVGAISFDDVKGLKRALPAAYRTGAGFIGNDVVTTQLDGIKDTTGRYIYTENVQDENDFTRLLGRDYLEAGELTQNELWFANGAGYVITDVAGIRIDFGYATGDFENGRQSLRVMKRTGGSPLGTDWFAKLVSA